MKDVPFPAVGYALPSLKKQLENEEEQVNRLDFLKRLDETILFMPLSKDNIGGIIKLIAAVVISHGHSDHGGALTIL